MIKSDKAYDAVKAGEKKAAELGVMVCITVVDEHGTPIVLKRMDGAFVISPDFAYSKAYTSAMLKMPTSGFGEFVTPGAPYYGMTSMLGGKLCTISGGVPVTDGNKVVGAVGVGGSPDVSQDEEVAKAVLEALK